MTDWRERFVEKAAARSKPVRESIATSRHVRLSMYMSNVLNQAAKTEGISVMAFLRRAIMVRANTVLGIGVEDMVPHVARVGDYGCMGGYVERIEDYDTWQYRCSHPGCDGEHLR